MKKLKWDFPLPRTHTGILLGNGVQGLMVWGTDRLCITIGRAGFWDHRDATPFSARITFKDLRRLLEAGDKAGIDAAFASKSLSSAYRRPCQIGGGRLELRFSDNMVPLFGELDIHSATLRITLENAKGRRAMVVIRQAMDAELAWVETSASYKVDVVTTWDHIGEKLAKDGVKPPRRWTEKNAGGFCQTLPEDDPLAIAWERRGRQMAIATVLGDDAEKRARAVVKQPDIAGAGRRANAWWRQYWRDVPRVALPEQLLQHTWDYGLYRQAGLTTPGGVAATLQGPWMEEYQLPPWSNDYHFNINIEMIYWPALGTGRTEHFKPLWDMMLKWEPLLRDNAKKFFGVDDAMMLPHAVDDRCGVVGSFWTGTIDHACIAWMAQMAWLHYRYSMDENILRSIAWPLLNGAFNGYWAMIEEVEENGKKRLSLPVSVSPEYGGSSMQAWGRDASFQLAALHCLAAILPKAAAVIGQQEDPRWARVRNELPPYSVYDGRRIGLWEGQDLSGSHRHHSHLASIYPFCSIDPFAPEHREIVKDSLVHWEYSGAGPWTGWCLTWASIICARCNMADAAVAWLTWWKEAFTNVGHGTLHDSDIPGVGGLHRVTELESVSPANCQEIMQMDAAMGALNAILELLVQSRGDVVHILPAIPRRWRELSFDGIRTEGAFLVGATVKRGRVVEVRVSSLAGGVLRLAHGLGERWTINGKRGRGAVLELATQAGEKWTLKGA